MRRSFKKPRRRPADEPGPIVKTVKDRQLFTPRLSPDILPILARIGVPVKKPFVPDQYQVEALARLDEGDVVVSAPTGAGKTYIASQAMSGLLAKGGRSWYASPLKALSNSKFIEFRRKFGPDNVGLLTGDHKVNPEAPIIVGTTEILRNQLYDAMESGLDLQVDLVVIDEAHYLGDIERGVVWEEVLIYLPDRVQLLLLSATVANAREITAWLGTIRRKEASAVIAHQRPVPLYPLFLFPDGLLTSLNKGRGLSPQIRHYLELHPPRGPAAGRERASFSRILRVLRQADLLPAIFFLKSRADCDQALGGAFGAGRPDPEVSDRLDLWLTRYLEQNPFLKDHPHLRYLRGPGVAAHHAGHLPQWKLLVEQLMQEGLLTAIFSTSTVAAGVNFPARTVVICQSDRFNGREFVDLTATELLQMTGRAGRRGMDQIGFAMIVPGPFQDPRLIHSLFNAPPDPVVSQIQINFSMALNLLLSHRPEQIEMLLDLSLANYQRNQTSESQEVIRLIARLRKLLQGSACSSPEKAWILRRNFRRLTDEDERLERARPEMALESSLEAALVPGRLFLAGGGQIYCLLALEKRRGQAGVLAAKVKEDFKLKKGQPRQRWLPLTRIQTIFQTKLDLEQKTSPEKMVNLIRTATRQDHQVLDLATLASNQPDRRLEELEARLARIRSELDRMACNGCKAFQKCQGAKSQANQLFYKLEEMESVGQAGGRLLWSSFLRHFEFLVAEGYALTDGELTEDGRWAARLRLDHPLLIAAGIRAAAWPQDDPALLASTVAPFVVDKELPSDEIAPKLPPGLAEAWMKIDLAISPLLYRLKSSGFGGPRLSPRPALAIYSWATLGQWDEAVRLHGQDQGDLAMLVLRTADNLRQMASLSSTHPYLARTASEAIEMILKEPVEPTITSTGT